jgi:hypothetical protein
MPRGTLKAASAPSPESSIASYRAPTASTGIPQYLCELAVIAARKELMESELNNCRF